MLFGQEHIPKHCLACVYVKTLLFSRQELYLYSSIFAKLTWKTLANVREKVVVARNSSNGDPQTSPIFSQPQRAWATDSGTLLQMGQIDDWATYRLAKFSKVGRESVQALHAKVLFFIWHLYPPQTRPKLSALFSIWSRNKLPIFHLTQDLISHLNCIFSILGFWPDYNIFLRHKTNWEDFIFWASEGRKQVSIRNTFHQPELLPRRSATTASAGRIKIGKRPCPSIHQPTIMIYSGFKAITNSPSSPCSNYFAFIENTPPGIGTWLLFCKENITYWEEFFLENYIK